MRRFFKITGIIVGIFLLICAVVSGYCYYKIKTRKDTHDLQARIDKTCKEYVQKGKSAGLFVGIVQGDKVYMQGYGTTDKTNKRLPDSTTLFEIGSITKVFTTEIAQLLTGQHQLDWNDSIGKLIPGGTAMAVNDGTTLRHLAAHTAGFPRLPKVWFSKLERNSCDPYSSLTIQDLRSYLHDCTEKQKPSADNGNYSNLGMGLLGHIMEWKTNKSYEHLLQEYICRPLQMHVTSTTVTDTANFATGYDEQGNKTCHWSLPVLAGCGAIKSNGADMLRFLKANMRNSTALSASFIKTQQEIAGIPGGAIAYGWHIDKVSGLVLGIDKIVWHNGGTGGFRSYIGFVPGSNMGIVVFANQVNDNFDDLAITLLFKVMTTTMQ